MSDTGDSSALQTTLSMGQRMGKYIVMAVNVMFLIFGCVLCAVGSYALNNQVALLAGQTLPQGIIVIGSFLLILSLVGFVSAWKEFRIGLGIYFFFVTVLTIILFAVGIAVYVKRNDASLYISQAWIAAGTDNGVRSSLQVAFFCCGLQVFNQTGDAVFTPPCDTPDSGVTQRCLDPMVNSFQSNFQTAGSCGIAFSVIMVVSLAFTAYLMRGIRESAVNQAIEKNRARNERDMAKNKRKGKGLKIPQVGANIL